MKIKHILFATLLYTLSIVLFTACGNNDDDNGGGGSATQTDYTDLLTNQVNQVIIPSMVFYEEEMGDLQAAVNAFSDSIDETQLGNLRSAYQEAYLAYQAAAVHYYFATTNQSLVRTTNLYPVDVALLEELIETETYDFNTTAQERANGFPALDYLLYSQKSGVSYFESNPKNLAFLEALVSAMKSKADVLVDQWSGNLSANFIENGGTALGSSISVQLNESLVYYEDHIRENKVGIPIGLLGPNDSPIPADPTKIEAYYQSLAAGNEDFTRALLEASIEEMEDLYLGETPNGTDGQGYDDLLVARGQASIDEDINAQFEAIYTEIANRNSITGDESLYEAIQGLVTLYKSDLFPVLNIQDADGANDGD